MRPLPLGLRIVLLVVPLALLPLATVGGVAYYYLERTVRAETDAAHLRQIADASASFMRAVAEASSVAHVLAGLPPVEGLTGTSAPDSPGRQSASRALDTAVRLSSHVSQAGIVRPDGEVLATAISPGLPAPPLAGSTLGRLAGRPWPSDDERMLVVPTGGGQASIVIRHPLALHRDTLLLVALELPGLMREIQHPLTGGGGVLLLLDADGRLVSTSTPEAPELSPDVRRAVAARADAGPQALGTIAAAEGFDACAVSAGGLVDPNGVGRRGRPVVLLGLVQKLPLAERLNELRRMAVFLAGASLAFGLIGAGLLARSVVHPLDALLAMTRRIGEGRFDVSVPRIRNDEIGQLVDAFNAMAASLADYRDKLVRAETFAALGRVSSSVAHEVRNPLNAMRGCIEYLRLKRPDDPIVQHHAGMIAEEIEVLDRFVRDFLKVARFEQPRLATVNLADVLRSHVALNEQRAVMLGVRLTLSAAAPPPIVIADAQQLGIVFENLINNAMEAMPGGGQLQVQLEAGSGQARIVFADTGCGIPEAVGRSLFTPFFTTKAEGTGIGLAISRRVIDAHGGTIAISSAEGVGTIATVTLPLGASSQAADFSAP